MKNKQGKSMFVVIVVVVVLVLALAWYFISKMQGNNTKARKATKTENTIQDENKLSDRATLYQINDAISLIDDGGGSTYYVVCGTEKALIIDTGNGYDDVLKIARKITDLPIEVVNTHGHVDHVYGNRFCKEVWIHPDDMEQCKSVLGSSNRKKLTLSPLSIGQIFYLGELELEVIEIAGHTPGSIGLLDRKHRILFSGDAMNPYIWLQLKESLPLSKARKNIGEMMDTYGDEFDYHLSGHTTGLIPKQAIYDLLEACDEILEGNNREDKDYEWFGGVGKYHLYGDGEGKQVCYDPHNL